MLMGTKSQLFFPFWAFNSWIYYVGFFSFCVFFCVWGFFFLDICCKICIACSHLIGSFHVSDLVRIKWRCTSVFSCWSSWSSSCLHLVCPGTSTVISLFDLLLLNYSWVFVGFFVMFMHFFYFISALALTSCSPGSLMSTSWKRRI